MTRSQCWRVGVDGCLILKHQNGNSMGTKSRKNDYEFAVYSILFTTRKMLDQGYIVVIVLPTKFCLKEFILMVYYTLNIYRPIEGSSCFNTDSYSC